MEETRLWNPNYVKVWCVNFMIFFSFMVVTPLLPLYLSETYHAYKDTIGLVLSGYTLTALLARPIAGYLVDSFSRKVVLLTYDKSQDAWSMTSDGVTKELFRYTSDKQAIKAVLNGEEKVFTLNEQGVFDARMAAGEGLFFAAR